MDVARWRRVGEIFDRVIELAPDRREAALAELCTEDDALRGEVERLVASARDETQFEADIDTLRAELADAWVREQDDVARAGDRVGPWRVVRELGRGGMGIVLLVERADGQFEQRAALKLVKRGMDSDAVLARFLRERQIVAHLDHPNIARLLDGGIGGDGRPYFAMEYVEGEPLLAYCHARCADLATRIALFLDICAAVQFAHQQLIVHRDLKPSNVLVAPGGQVKLLDFGIATLLAPDAGTAEPTIDLRDRPLTPSYAAPEQLGGDAISTATDVYALGCILYELVAGRRPREFDASASLAEMLRQIEAGRPPLPSEAASPSAPVPARRLRGDLDTIVMTALRRAPERRYATVAALAADLCNFRDGLPIAARRDSPTYRLRKFVGRHRAAVGLAATAALALAGVSVFAMLQAERAATEARTATQVRDFMVDIFATADPDLHPGRDISAKELLDDGTAKLRAGLPAQPAIRDALLRALRDSYGALGLDDKAEALARESIASATAEFGRDAVEAARAHVELAVLLENQRDFPQAADEARRALPGLGARPSIEAVQAHLLLARDFRYRNDVDHEREEAQRALALLHHLDAAPPFARARASYIAALSALDSSDFAIAETAMRDALADLDVASPASAAETRRVVTMRAILLCYLGRNDDALATFDALLDDERTTLGADHPLVAEALRTYSAVLQRMSRLADAQHVAEDAVATIRRGGGTRTEIAAQLENLAEIAAERGDLAEARSRIEEERALFAGDDGNAIEPPFLLPIAWARVRAMRGEAGGTDAYRALLDASDLRSESMWEERILLGWAYLYDGRAADALAWVQTLKKDTPRYDSPRARAGRTDLALVEAAALVELGRDADAMRALQTASALLAKAPSDVQRATLLLWRGRAEMRTGSTSEALADLASARALREAAFGEDSAWTAEAELAHADALAFSKLGAEADEERAQASLMLAQMRAPDASPPGARP
ncbi:MAG TPA: protein kinase [Rhodanobacteraceae bacterium]|nr:protein kinase [Rhodanobacteraceae bacterium]